MITSSTRPTLSNGIQSRTLFIGDNLHVLRGMNSRCIDLIYLDPPFNSNQVYKAPMDSMSQGAAFDDMWTPDSFRDEWMEELERDNPELHAVILGATRAVDAGAGAYLSYMAQRLLELRRVLKRNGTIYLHCDDAAVHYLKAVMDAIFDAERYMGTIMWKRTSAHNDSKSWGRIADYILCYGRRPIDIDHIRVPLDGDYTDRFYRFSSARWGAYRLSDLTGAGIRTGESGKAWRGVNPTGKNRHWAVSRHSEYADWIEKNVIDDYKGIEGVHDRLDALQNAGLIQWPKKQGGMPQLIRPLESAKGQAPGNVWTDINPVGAHSKEKTQWKTQKPEALLRRIILASSRPAEHDADGNVTRQADWVLDPFCGCATACVVAEDLDRNWIGIDLESQAEKVLRDRLFVRERRHHTQLILEQYKGDFTTRTTPPKRTDDEDDEKIHPDLNDFLYGLQEHRCNGCGRELDIIDMESDHIVPSSKGGEKYTERNRNLLCGRCNRRKSNKYTIAELREILKKEDQIAFDMSTLDPKRELAFQQRKVQLRRRRMNRGEV